jgi:hypothetical protein
MKIVRCAAFFCTSVITTNGFAQPNALSQRQVWLGYMTSTHLNKKYSLWNDTHFVPKGFFILRTGITARINPVNITIGYAYGRLPVSANSNNLNRIEHRPWAQVQAFFPVSNQFTFIPRVRHDARFRQDVVNGELVNSYSFLNRIRLMATLRKFITKQETTIGKPFIGISDELLLNFGKNVTFNRFDQNRLSLIVGTQYRTIQVQFGYMNRYVKATPNQFIQNHTLLLWVTHTFNLKRTVTENNVEQDGE